MSKYTTQEERLSYLIDVLKKETVNYQDIRTPREEEQQQAFLRILMNGRMPQKTDAEVLAVQDEYLKERNQERGIVQIEDLQSAKELGSPVPYADQLYVWQGDITTLAADAIVNAANSQMLGCFIPMHSCIDNCIHTYAGMELRAECARQMRALRMKYGDDYEQPTAVPMLTPGYNLPAKHVIHVVGPIVNGPLTRKEEKELSECYRASLEMAEENGLKSIAFCCISTGVFRFPPDRAAMIAVQTAGEYLRETGSTIRIIFNVFKNEDLERYDELLGIKQ